MIKNSIACLAFLGAMTACAQDVQQIRGRVTSLGSGKPLPGAAVVLNGARSYTFYSDSSGYYHGSADLGNYSMLIYCPMYCTQTRQNIILLSGKQQVQDVELAEHLVTLDSVSVIAPPGDNAVTLDLWNSQRFAAAFYDPARTLTSYSGNINADDQANNISVHGTSPAFNRWKLEGVEIVNPNHLENAGTINDRPSPNGGGVSLFSAQLLQNSGFQLAPFDPSSGNCLSGLFDMKLRSGNNQKYEHAVQASLLGTDLSIEGPFSKQKQASFLVNYRFSTVGLLSRLGVNFGGEQIDYQDLSFTVTLPYARGKARLFGMAGNSKSIFRGPEDSTELVSQKDLLNIDYHSFTGIAGANIVTSISNTLLWRCVIAYSAKKTDRTEVPGFFHPVWESQSDRFTQQKISTLNYLSKRLNSWLRLKAGAYVNYMMDEMKSSSNEVTFAEGSLNDLVLEPFVSFEGDIKKVDMAVGLHGTYQPRINDFVLQPRVRVGWQLSDQHYLMVRYGISSQLQPGWLYMANEQNKNLKQSLTNMYALEYHIMLRNLKIKNEFFYQDFDRLPENESNGFSAFNYFNEQIPYALSSTGKAKVYGYDLTVERDHNNFYIIASASIFRSQYKIQNSWYDGRFNSDYNCALTLGKEFILKNKNKMLSADVRGFVRNGFREQELYFYEPTLAEYYRMDFRISYRKNKTKSAVIWALDVQNLTNRQNEAYHYYDRYTQKEETRYQLGIIPVLSYKVLF
jgi:hypothetical protein